MKLKPICKYGLVNERGELITDLKYDEVTDFIEGFAKVRIGVKWGFINEQGKEITPIKYDYVFDFENKFAIVRLNRKETFINEKGQELTELKYDCVNPFQNGFAEVQIGDEATGIINDKGKEIITPNNNLLGIHNGKVEMLVNGKIESIDIKVL